MSAGIYVHIPFCLTRCGYCDFNAYAGMDHIMSRYSRALRAEASMTAADWEDERIDSVFLGGGTPTTLPPEDLAELLAHLRANFDLTPDAEVTIEANPDTIDEPRLRALREAGYSRLSMGAQSFDTGVLAALERLHSPQAVRGAFAAARRAGYENVNLDLIYGADGETVDSWRETLRETIALGPEHVSAYALTIEPATPLGRKVAAGTVSEPDSDLQADMYALACELLREAGYAHYEVSNWARPGRECRHNLTYWRRASYLGLGAGAHSFRGNSRWWNVRPPEQYLQTIERGVLPKGAEELLTEEESRLEEMFLGLRTSEGVAAASVAPGVAERFLEDALICRRNGSLVLTERGMFLANELVLALSAADC